MIRVFNSIIFLFSISIGALMLPSLIPKVTALGIFILFIAILINSYRNFQDNPFSYNNYLITNMIKNMNYSNIFIPSLGVLIIAFWMLLRSVYIPHLIISNISIVLIHSLFLIFIVNTRYFLTDYLKTYIYFVFVMSFCGALASLLIINGIYPIEGNYVNLDLMTRGSFSRDAGIPNSYVFPYKLGLILTGETRLNFLGYDIFRSSGWAHEPTSATLFIMPALLLILQGDIIRNKLIRFLLFTTISLFWIFCASVGSFLAVMIVFGFYILTNLYIKFFPFKMSLIIFLGLVSSLFILALYLEPILESTLFSTKFDLESETFGTFLNEFLWFLPNPNLVAPNFFYFGHLLIWVLICMFLWIIVSDVISTGRLSTYSLILIYLILHTMKGSQESVYTHLFIFFWFYLAYFSTIKKINLFN